MPALKEFHLVGGTALTLQMGHRNSIDIDLFTRNDFNTNSLLTLLKSKYTLEVRYDDKNTIIAFIQGIKVDFIKHNYAYVKPPLLEEGINFYLKKTLQP